MPTTVVHGFYFINRLAAAGISKFQVGRAGLPLALMVFIMLMRFSAGTGVFIGTPSLNGCCCFIVVGFVRSWFRH